tara:strand:- start:221 stop:820 length:600 start_codon:yes stop_codon:yes gene_type:complete
MLKKKTKSKKKTSHKYKKNKPKIKTIFITCRGNTCRSPTAQYILEAIHANNKKIKFNSCGTKIRKKNAPLTINMRKTLKKMNLKKALKKAQNHKSKSCTCRHLELVGESNGTFYYVEKKIRNDLRKLGQECIKKNPKLKLPKFKMLNTSNIIDPYDYTCQSLIAKNSKKKTCSRKDKKKSKLIYRKTVKQIKKSTQNIH